jgi:hypothetical protein
MNELLKPTDFADFPNRSIMGSINDEGVAWNIVRILMVTGNKWRTITWEEYAIHHSGDSMKEDGFNRVIKYCISAEKARRFCPQWAHAAETAYSYARFVNEEGGCTESDE